jgi:biopolymer transport protein ExbD
MRALLLVLGLTFGCSREQRLGAACEAGDPDACDALGYRYAYGDGVSRDPARAEIYVKRAAHLCEQLGKDAGEHVACKRISTAIPLDVPGIGAPSQDAPSPVVTITITPDGHTTVAGVAADDDDTFRKVAASHVSRDARAVIKADADAKHGQIIHLLDLLKQVGFTKIAFGVTPLSTEAGAP